MRLGILLSVLVLAACGVDGAPQAPQAPQSPQPNVTVTGDATIGVTGTL